MERITNSDVQSAFRTWCTLAGAHAGGQPPYKVDEVRLGHDGYGRVRIELITSESGSIRTVTPNLTKRAFCDAVYLLDEFFKFVAGSSKLPLQSVKPGPTKMNCPTCKKEVAAVQWMGTVALVCPDCGKTLGRIDRG
jgi:predicted RNA-binding Zn-ribbon protein involved in translation (DUF1610 family)